MKFGIANIFALTVATSVSAFSPLSSNLIASNKPSVGGRSSISPLSAKPQRRKIERDWTYTDENGETYEAGGKLEVKVFLPDDGNVKGCVFFMHGFSQYTKAYQDTLEKVANKANVAVISSETGIVSGVVLGELLSDPLAMIKDRTRAQFVLQRALSEDTKQCINMVMKGDDVFKELNIGKNVPLGVSGHSMGGGLSFPVAADCPKVNYVFTMAPVAGVPQFNPIEQGVDMRTVNNSMLVAGTWDLIAKADKIEDIYNKSNEKKKNSSTYVEIDRGLHTGFEDELVITKISLDSILGKFLDLSCLSEKLLFSLIGFVRTNTGQLKGSEELMGFFFEKMVKGQKVTAQAADQYLEENIKEKWDKKFTIV